MGDYICIMCQDKGDCEYCSWGFQADGTHSVCGKPWKDHKTETNQATGNAQKYYYNSTRAICPK